MATIQNINTTIIIVIITTFTIAFYLFYQPSKQPNKSFTYQNTTDHTEVTINETTITLNKEIIKPMLLNPRFPQCYAQIEYSTLSEILYQYHLNNTCVGPKCSIKIKTKQTSKENAGLLVAYVAVTLLLISLIAAFLEVIKAKKVPVQNKTKPELSRRCSLADLTVLRHHRRESMIRRDSTLSIDDSTKRTSLKTIGRKMSRPRLRVT